MPYSKEKSLEVYVLVKEIGIKDTAFKLGISESSVERALRFAKKYLGVEDTPTTRLIEKIQDRFSERELKALARGNMIDTKKDRRIHDFTGNDITIGVMTDTHIGSKHTDLRNIYEAFEVFAKEGVDFVCHSGDVTEGNIRRDGHVYEMTDIGFDAQLDKSIEVFSQFSDAPIYAISGNHDLWYHLSAGANIVKAICSEVENMHFLGNDEGDIILSQLGYKTPVTIRLWHGADTGSYAVSYRLQKLVESFTGGDKPHILFAGHVHKATYLFERHIHCVSAGAMQRQTPFMRGKRIASHTGFWIVKITVNKSGVGTFNSTFYPFYV